MRQTYNSPPYPQWNFAASVGPGVTVSGDKTLYRLGHLQHDLIASLFQRHEQFIFTFLTEKLSFFLHPFKRPVVLLLRNDVKFIRHEGKIKAKKERVRLKVPISC